MGGGRGVAAGAAGHLQIRYSAAVKPRSSWAVRLARKVHRHGVPLQNRDIGRSSSLTLHSSTLFVYEG